MPHSVDPTTQGTEFPRNYYWEGFQGQIVNLSQVDANVRLWKPESPRPVDETAEIKEDIPSSYLFYSHMTLPSDVDIVLAHAEMGTNHWQDFQRQIVNPSHAEASVIFLEPESPQLIGETAQVEDIRSSYSPYSYRNLLSVVEAEMGTNHWQDFQRQIVNPSHAEANVIFLEPESPQLVGETAQIGDVCSSYLFNSSMTLPSDMDVVLAHAEIGTAITDFTQLRKYQAWKQRLEISGQFDILAQWEDNWDGRGSQKPTDLTLVHAKKVMGALLDSIISAGHWCDTPSISSDGDGNVSTVWYKDERQLHLQIGEHEAEYFRVWGTNIDTEMDVDFLKPENYLTLWEWLIDERQLHLQIGEHEAEYFKVWGTNIDTEMDVDFLKPENYLTLWEWLIDE